ncbi:unnamed protein product [Haemonchus placei]|uniref:DUF4378 domain-containing protein n=1 Tax=Haemonchus placei TaxID=6290 RepID=A0A0N4VT26_HAEPC|nr:unnamed protein product [Haemonchus placei]
MEAGLCWHISSEILMASASAPLKNVAKATKRILMCRPTYFQLTYSINPWMDMRRGVNRPKAMEQWEKLKSTLEECGARVDVMEADVSHVIHIEYLICNLGAHFDGGIESQRAFLSFLEAIIRAVARHESDTENDQGTKKNNNYQNL